MFHFSSTPCSESAITVKFAVEGVLQSVTRSKSVNTITVTSKQNYLPTSKLADLAVMERAHIKFLAKSKLLCCSHK